MIAEPSSVVAANPFWYHTIEVAPGVVLDFDAEGRLVGIDIDHASQIADLSRLEAEALPIGSLSVLRP